MGAVDGAPAATLHRKSKTVFVPSYSIPREVHERDRKRGRFGLRASTSSSPLSCPGREGRCALRGAKHVWRHSYLNQRNPTQHLSKEQKARLRNKLRRAHGINKYPQGAGSVERARTKARARAQAQKLGWNQRTSESETIWNQSTTKNRSNAATLVWHALNPFTPSEAE